MLPPWGRVYAPIAPQAKSVLPKQQLSVLRAVREGIVSMERVPVEHVRLGSIRMQELHNAASVSQASSLMVMATMAVNPVMQVLGHQLLLLHAQTAHPGRPRQQGALFVKNAKLVVMHRLLVLNAINVLLAIIVA